MLRAPERPQMLCDATVLTDHGICCENIIIHIRIRLFCYLKLALYHTFYAMVIGLVSILCVLKL